ncbi:copper chaperone PCu(A)C [Arcobacter sp. LA11]|uniref:copper chaperone PCu(A)C n=1 Tax=Arcobacter sp. LA11 TaxID=1898176 RepID=UPI0009320DA4|nr:copper chaperone PCu(A)C [Arcobacter sp. LA11]
MKKLFVGLFLCVASLFASNIEIKDAYARATPPGLPNSAAFMTISNPSSSDISLIDVKTTISNVAELHTHEMKNGMMKMYQVPKIEIKAHSKTILKPGGFHVMLLGLKKKPLTTDQKVNLTLIFSNNEKIEVSIPVKSVMGGMKMHKGMKMDHSNMKMDHK